VQDSVIAKRPGIMHEGDLFVCLFVTLLAFICWLVVFVSSQKIEHGFCV